MLARETQPELQSLRPRRRGAVSLDYILTLGTLLSMGAVATMYSRRLILLAYEVICGLISWPFM